MNENTPPSVPVTPTTPVSPSAGRKPFVTPSLEEVGKLTSHVLQTGLGGGI